MSTIKLNIPVSKTKEEQSPADPVTGIVDPVANDKSTEQVSSDLVASIPTSAVVASEVDKDADRKPCNWSILPDDGVDMIIAKNSITGSVFSGTTKEFSAMIKSI